MANENQGGLNRTIHGFSIGGTDEMPQVDITGNASTKVEIVTSARSTGTVLYVHINGITALRICRIVPSNLKINHEG